MFKRKREARRQSCQVKNLHAATTAAQGKSETSYGLKKSTFQGFLFERCKGVPWRMRLEILAISSIAEWNQKFPEGFSETKDPFFEGS